MYVSRKATLVFGMVNIPVGVASAVREHKHKDMHIAHTVCGTLLKRQTRCETCGCDVSQDQVKAVYQVGKNLLVDIPADEWSATLPSRSPVVQIHKTFPLQQLEPELVRKSYYLVPDKNFTVQYELFSQALSSTKLAALATSVLWGKENPAAVRADNGVITLNMMWCYDELIQPDADFDVLGQKLVPQELSLAKDILRAMQAPLEDEDLDSPSWREQLELIKAKVDNADYQPKPQTEPAKATVDMMSALKESVKQVQKKKRVARRPPTPPRRKAVKKAA